MICNEREYKITGKRIKEMKAALVLMQKQSDEPEWLRKAQVEAAENLILEMEKEVREYDLLKGGQVQFTECSNLEALPTVLIQARISKGLSQKGLGERLGLTAQQIQQYEASDYMGASRSRLIEASRALDVKITSV